MFSSIVPSTFSGTEIIASTSKLTDAVIIHSALDPLRWRLKAFIFALALTLTTHPRSMKISALVYSAGSSSLVEKYSPLIFSLYFLPLIRLSIYWRMYDYTLWNMEYRYFTPRNTCKLLAYSLHLLINMTFIWITLPLYLALVNGYVQ